MQEIVGSVQRVTDIIGEITAASPEQSDGIGQVNTSVMQLDQMTQQNAALVEESAAAAESLKEQAVKLAGLVGMFKLAEVRMTNRRIGSAAHEHDPRCRPGGPPRSRTRGRAAGGEFLTFRLGAEEYGIDILKVQEIRSYEQPTRIANAPAFIKGVVNLRGVIVPIVDLRVKLGCESVEYNSFTVVIVLTVKGRVVGAVVDSVSRRARAGRGHDQGRPGDARGGRTPASSPASAASTNAC